MMMAIYKITGHLTVSCWTEVEASTEKEAIKIASSRSVADFSIDNSYPVDECFHFDADGEPQKLYVEE